MHVSSVHQEGDIVGLRRAVRARKVCGDEYHAALVGGTELVIRPGQHARIVSVGV